MWHKFQPKLSNIYLTPEVYNTTNKNLPQLKLDTNRIEVGVEGWGGGGVTPPPRHNLK